MTTDRVTCEADQGATLWLQYASAGDLALATKLARVWKSGPKLCTLHVDGQWRHLRSWIGRQALSRVLSRYDRVCLLTSAQRRLLNGRASAKAHSIPTLLPGWVDEGLADFGPQLGQAGPIALYLGRVAPEKGVDDCIRAVSLALESGWPGRLWIAGGAEDAMQLKVRKLISQYDLNGKVRWLGILEQAEVREVLGQVNVVLSLSRKDAFPLSLLEARACGTEVIAYKLPGTTELCERFGGVTVEPGDVERVAAALIESERQQRQQGGVSHSRLVRKELAWTTVTDAYVNAILEARPRPHAQ